MSDDNMDVEKQAQDITGDGGVLKTVLVEASSGWETPSPGTEVFGMI